MATGNFAPWAGTSRLLHRQSGARETQRSPLTYDLIVDDDKLYPPFAVGDTRVDLTERLTSVPDSGIGNFLPGWDWAVIMTGLAGSIGRYRDGLGMSKGIAARAAVGEALWWIASADEYLRKRVSRDMALADYSVEIQQTAAGRRLAGLIFLRNRTGHQFAADLVQSFAAQSTSYNVRADDGSVTTVPVRIDLSTGMRPFDDSPPDGYFFAPLSSLPQADARFRERYNRDACYDEIVVGRLVVDVLNAAERSLNDAVSFRWRDSSLEILVNGAAALPSTS